VPEEAGGGRNIFVARPLRAERQASMPDYAEAVRRRIRMKSSHLSHTACRYLKRDERLHCCKRSS